MALSLLYPNSQVTWRDARGRLKERTRHLQKRNSFQSIVRLTLLKWWKTLFPVSSRCTTTFCAGLDLQAQDTCLESVTCLETDYCTNWRKHTAGDKAKISPQKQSKTMLTKALHLAVVFQHCQKTLPPLCFLLLISKNLSCTMPEAGIL